MARPRARFNLGWAAYRRLARRWGPPAPPGLRLQMAAAASWLSAVEAMQRWAWRQRLEQAAPAPPIFIVGHWRSGTTLLHELLCTAPGLGYPTTAACMRPQYFLLEQAAPARAEAAILRPMDAMKVTAASPQEDEFALFCLGLPSPYAAFVHPRALGQVLELADLDRLGPAERRAWEVRFREFLAGVSLLAPDRRIVLKSPPHSLRIGALSALCPGAAFIHIVRDPRRVHPSAVGMWRSMFDLYAVGEPVGAAEIARISLDTITAFDAAIEHAAARLPADRFVRVRFEDLVAQPGATVRTIYDRLGLGAFEQARPVLEAALDQRRHYRPAAPDRGGDASGAVAEYCAALIDKYGYRRGNPPRGT
jgi:hypothetical protein